MTYRVSCITKHSTYERITHLECVTDTGLKQRFTEDEAIKRIRSGDEFHVTQGGRTAKVVIAEHEGRPYLKTERDGFKPDNLLSLPHCSNVPKPVTPPVRTTPTGSHSVK
jgi:Protein of unknown function (DUF3892)